MRVVILQPSRGSRPLSAKSTRFFAALRPASLVVALATCALGITLASLDAASVGPLSVPLAIAVLVSGVLLQVGVNLVNDHADLQRVDHSDAERKAITRNAMFGVGAIAIACAIGLWLVISRGWPLLALGVTGVFGLWAYAADPINLKARGLGLPAVFLLTGVLMVSGAYYAVTGTLSWAVIVWSIPLSLFAMALLLANELRDYERDRALGLRTFTVRFGYRRGVFLYLGLGVAIALLTLILAFAFSVPRIALSVSALALLPLRALRAPPDGRARLMQSTGRAYALYSGMLLAGLWSTLL